MAEDSGNNCGDNPGDVGTAFADTPVVVPLVMASLVIASSAVAPSAVDKSTCHPLTTALSPTDKIRGPMLDAEISRATPQIVPM